MAALGLDGVAFLRSTDPAERLAMVAVARRAARIRRSMDESLANAIAKAVGRLFGG